jgi:hypothetical protein
MDAQGIQVHALSLINPMPYFADADSHAVWHRRSMTRSARHR